MLYSRIKSVSSVRAALSLLSVVLSAIPMVGCLDSSQRSEFAGACQHNGETCNRGTSAEREIQLQITLITISDSDYFVYGTLRSPSQFYIAIDPLSIADVLARTEFLSESGARCRLRRPVFLASYDYEARLDEHFPLVPGRDTPFGVRVARDAGHSWTWEEDDLQPGRYRFTTMCRDCVIGARRSPGDQREHAQVVGNGILEVRTR